MLPYKPDYAILLNIAGIAWMLQGTQQQEQKPETTAGIRTQAHAPTMYFQ